MSNGLEPGQVWVEKSTGFANVIIEVRGGDIAMTAPDRGITLDRLRREFSLVGVLADRWLLRAHPTTKSVDVPLMLRIRADAQETEGQRMIENAKKLREAADLLEAT